MTLVLGQYGVSMRDARGQVGRVGGFYTFNNSSAAFIGDAASICEQIANAMAAMSNALEVRQYGLASQIFNPQQYGANVTYPNVEDKARLVYRGQNGSRVTFSIPAPKGAIFLTDGETVDPGGSLLATLTGLLTSNDAGGGFAASNQGDVIVAFIAGSRVRRPFQRKTTIWTKDPSETIPEE